MHKVIILRELFPCKVSRRTSLHQLFAENSLVDPTWSDALGQEVRWVCCLHTDPDWDFCAKTYETYPSNSNEIHLDVLRPVGNERRVARPLI